MPKPDISKVGRDLDLWFCEICGQNHFSKDLANDCEQGHKRSSDIFYRAYMDCKRTTGQAPDLDLD